MWLKQENHCFLCLIFSLGTELWLFKVSQFEVVFNTGFAGLFSYFLQESTSVHELKILLFIHSINPFPLWNFTSNKILLFCFVYHSPIETSLMIGFVGPQVILQRAQSLRWETCGTRVSVAEGCIHNINSAKSQ